MSSEATSIPKAIDNQLEISELRDKIYLELKKIYGAMRAAAIHANCSEYQLRLVLKGKDTNPEILKKAAEWLKEHQLNQAATLNQFALVASQALSM
jgi:hypothetical protein